MHSLFGPYWLLRRIGLGDLAEVFVAKCTNGGDAEAHSTSVRYESPGGPCPGTGLVAVKRLSREMASYDAVLRLFAREGQLARQFQHPKVVRVFDVGDVSGRLYIAMEYIPGADLARLRDRIAPRRLPPGLVVRVILDVCEALSYVHSATDGEGVPLDVVHGDITPANILVSTTGVAKVIDFSVASSGLVDAGERTVRGTYAYMSPEQVRGQPIDQRTDVFAVGVVMWEMLAAQRLFWRRANYLTLAAVVEDEVPRLAEMPGFELGAGGAALDRILDRALAKGRDDRYASISELSAELEPVAEKLGWDVHPWTLEARVRDLLS